MTLLPVLGLVAALLASASADASTTRPTLGLTAAPARLALVGADRATIRVTNPGTGPVSVDVARAGFALDPRGRPRIVGRADRRSATPWLTIRPGRLVLPAGVSGVLTVTSRVPTRAEPGDHDALVLLTTRPRPGAGLGVRMRVGVVVVVRAPGRVVRRLQVPRVHVRRTRRGRSLEVLVTNRGNVTESLARGIVRVSLRRGAARVTLQAEPRELRPRTQGVVELPLAGRDVGWSIATVQIAPQPDRPGVTRAFRIRL